LVCLAGALGSFRDAAEDLLRRLAGVRLSASTVLRATERAGEQLQQQQRQGDVAVPPKPTDWNFTVPKHAHTAAYLGLDAFSVPIQGPGGKKADSRMLYVGLLYTPDKKQTHYLVDFDLDQRVLGRHEHPRGFAYRTGFTLWWCGQHQLGKRPVQRRRERLGHLVAGQAQLSPGRRAAGEHRGRDGVRVHHGPDAR